MDNAIDAYEIYHFIYNFIVDTIYYYYYYIRLVELLGETGRDGKSVE